MIIMFYLLDTSYDYSRLWYLGSSSSLLKLYLGNRIPNDLRVQALLSAVNIRYKFSEYYDDDTAPGARYSGGA
jgi:hypothetical protein